MEGSYIGSFSPNSAKATAGGFDEYSLTNYVLAWEMVLVLMVLLCNVNLTFLAVMKLIIDGDVESNPGLTYIVKKSVKANFYQGDPMFGISAGMQCSCNTSLSICWAKIRKVDYWKTCDLDYILVKGDELFKNINLYRYLALKTFLVNCD